MKQLSLFGIIVVLGFVVASCDDEPLCDFNFPEGPFMSVKSDYTERLIIHYANLDGEGDSILLIPDEVKDVPIDANSSQMTFVILNKEQVGDTITFDYTTSSVECNDRYFLSLDFPRISRDTTNQNFSYFPMYYEREDLDRDGLPQDISKEENWPIYFHQGILVR